MTSLSLRCGPPLVIDLFCLSRRYLFQQVSALFHTILLDHSAVLQQFAIAQHHAGLFKRAPNHLIHRRIVRSEPQADRYQGAHEPRGVRTARSAPVLLQAAKSSTILLTMSLGNNKPQPSSRPCVRCRLLHFLVSVLSLFFSIILGFRRSSPWVIQGAPSAASAHMPSSLCRMPARQTTGSWG